ncbi:NADH-FMN oxidoreductase RutF, flavin reductase (DIM6/NTAB) family [Burkholderia sp. OK233]|nr:NADH-FMN oxidoreductase RutF, flavin reductase (DIM6/NTAB) family [Burkholderia sp. OK233]
MKTDVDAFRKAMRQLAGGVTVITTSNGTERAGLTATAVCSLSVNPPRVLVCVNLSGATYRLLSQSRRMAVNVLGTQHEDVAKRFGGMLGGADEDPFTFDAWSATDGRAPVFDDAAAWFECSVEEMVLTRTHAIVIGDVAQVGGAGNRSPLIYVDGAFCQAVQAGKQSAAAA